MENEGAHSTDDPFSLNEARLALLILGEVVEEDPYEQDLPKDCFARPSMDHIFEFVGLESWSMDPAFISEQQRALHQAAERCLVEYPVCERRPNVLTLRPKPQGGGTVEVESLAGYILRLANINKIVPDTFANFIWAGFPENEIKQFGGCLAFQGQGAGEPISLHPLEAALRLPRQSLYRQTLLPVYRQFYYGKPDELTMTNFFAKSEFKVCPLCLSDPDSYYRLIWNLYEVTVCVRHAVYLMNRCHKCNQPLKSLTERSAFGRCDECRTPLAKAKPVKAFEADVARQEILLDDYSRLLAAGERDEGRYLGDWRDRLRAIRVKRGLSVDEVADHLEIMPQTVIETEFGREITTFVNLLAWIRYLCGSVQAFSESKDRVSDSLSDPKVCEMWTCNNRRCPWFRSFKTSGAQSSCDKCRNQPLDALWEMGAYLAF